VAGKTGFLFFQPTFNPKHQGNTLKTLSNQYMASQNTKNHPKTHIQPETKNFLKLISIFILGVFKVRKHLILTPFIIWNHLTQNRPVLVVEIVVNDNFFFLSRNSANPSLFH